jgi:cell division protein FtsQ
VAKIDAYKNRGTTFVDDEQDDAYLRPASSSRQRAERDYAPDRPSARNGEGEGEAFLRSRRRVPVRKGILPGWAATRWGRIVLACAALVLMAGAVALYWMVRNFLDHDPRFRIDTAASIQTVGNSQLTRQDMLAVFGSDIGRNVFFVPLRLRRTELEQIPWVEHATVMRLLPNQLRVAVRERTPIAFVRIGDQIKLVDEAGVILDMPTAMMAAKHFSFPVVTGIHPGDPLSTRTARMHLYQRFIAELDASGGKISSQLSEVDLSDPEDVRTTVPARGSDLLLHFGDENFLARYRVYQTHLAEWEQQYPHLAAVDLRYDGQVVLKMADGAAAQAGQQSATGDDGLPSANAKPAPKAVVPARPAVAKKHPVSANKNHPGKVQR